MVATYLYRNTKGRNRRVNLVMVKSVLLSAGKAIKNTSCRRRDGWKCRWLWKNKGLLGRDLRRVVVEMDSDDVRENETVDMLLAGSVCSAGGIGGRKRMLAMDLTVGVGWNMVCWTQREPVPTIQYFRFA
jgi:hypothetical protein